VTASDPHEADTSYAPGAETRRSAAHDVTARQCTPDSELSSSVSENVATVLHILQHGIDVEQVRTPTAAEHDARRLAQRSVAMAALPRAYRIGSTGSSTCASKSWRGGRAARRRVSAAGLIISETTANYIDRVSEELVSAYEYEKEHWLRNLGAARAGRAKALLRGEQVDIDSSEAILGYRLRQHQVGVICWTSASDACSSTGLKG